MAVSHNCQTLREEESRAKTHTGAHRGAGAGLFLGNSEFDVTVNDLMVCPSH